ncbi:MAG: hypothetical protein HN915_04895 [Candidatus Marinimicrobia bacterium]|jgi:transcriptional regulator of heat shock response|uniref:Uncharacterized protein n=1 Tax=uncultured bacterium FPPZ_5C6 TaxID=1343849 RepID=S4W4C8_9BACT|nr:hypothetical protein [uncultured bacterium FPPZ_5C6]MBT3478611.1 hypothetical protein [Candidatus Neomarinimicrobiota bacterium]MBT3676528.1 hypothetical protein [Candidatus Neomarinimicrobiota bacterium]MBT3762517.1 hypothetical protein [Candidatus Neomarinimicrobiota bacterium]MBT4069340.1 hypothetical protein [Candidatus Neomarinimicrobiota bacterium]
MIKKYIIKYSIEFVVIILGITVSFWLNELSIDNQNEKERMKVLSSLQMEINEIKFFCEEKKVTWGNDIRLLNEFLNPKNGTFHVDNILKITTSKNRIETFMVLYRVFNPPLNRYQSIINSGDLKYVKSEKVKEILSRLHNTSLSHIETAVEHEKQLKQSFLPFLTENHPNVVLARDNNRISVNRYSDILNEAINSDNRLNAKLVLLKRYLEYKSSILQKYMINLDDLDREINLVLSN